MKDHSIWSKIWLLWIEGGLLSSGRAKIGARAVMQKSSFNCNGLIYTGDWSSIWDELGQRTVARLIIRSLPKFVPDRWSISRINRANETLSTCYTGLWLRNPTSKKAVANREGLGGHASPVLLHNVLLNTCYVSFPNSYNFVHLLFFYHHMVMHKNNSQKIKFSLSDMLIKSVFASKGTWTFLTNTRLWVFGR